MLALVLAKPIDEKHFVTHKLSGFYTNPKKLYGGGYIVLTKSTQIYACEVVIGQLAVPIIMMGKHVTQQPA